MRQLFVSYARKNKPEVDELVGDLEAFGYSAWVDSQLRGGQTWWAEILGGVEACDAFVATVSRETLASVACRRELEWALALGKPVLPVVVERPPEALPRELSMRQLVDYTQPGRQAMRALLEALTALPEPPPLPEPLPQVPPAPLSYLSDFIDLVSQREQPLTHEQQHAVLIKLQPALDSTDTEEREGARYVLDTFSGRADLYADVDRSLTALRAADESKQEPTGAAAAQDQRASTVQNTGEMGRGNLLADPQWADALVVLFTKRWDEAVQRFDALQHRYPSEYRVQARLAEARRQRDASVDELTGNGDLTPRARHHLDRESRQLGTATAAVLAQALVREALRNVVAGANPLGLKRGIEKAVEKITETLLASAREVETKDQLAAIASTSARHHAVGDLIAEALDRVGNEGVITVKESNTSGLQLELKEGMHFDSGYLSDYFVTDAQRQEAVLDDPFILVVRSKILAATDLAPLLGKLDRYGQPMLIVAEDVEGEALSTLVVNKIHGTFKSVAVKAPGIGDYRKKMLQDIAILTGGQVISEEVGLSLETADVTLLGRARKVVVTKDETNIVDGSGDSDAIAGRVAQIRAEIENSDSHFDREKLQERLAKLAGGVAVITAGASTEAEFKERKHRIEDAVRHAKAAIEEGFVAGGGVALLQAAPSLDELKLSGDEVTGVSIVRVALEAPLKRIAVHAGLEPDIIAERVHNLPPGHGLNAATGEYEDLIAAGVADPVKVTRLALQSAASIAAQVLSTETSALH